jgi:hypothetical protein
MALVGVFTVLAAVSRSFAYDRANFEKPILFLVVLLNATGALYLWLVLRRRPLPSGKPWFWFMVLVGLLCRVFMFPSAPILEDDSYRYLWEGGMVAHGFSPYAHSVRDILDPQIRDIPERLAALAKEADPVPQRVNHPWLKTIYPPLSQFAFALAHFFCPWDMAGWRLVLLVADLLSLYLLYLLLRLLNLSPSALAIYWWNPLLIKETYNSGHMDLILLPFLLGALILSFQRRYAAASAFLGLAVGVKLWPVILLPAVLKPIFREPKRLAFPLFVFFALSLPMLLPFFLAGLDSRSGLSVYLARWEMNDSLFLILLWLSQITIHFLALDAAQPHSVAGAAALALFALWGFSLLKKPAPNPQGLISLFLLLTAGLFFLSPTQFPWYYIWMLPFLSLNPRISLLLFTPLLPIYYLRFYFEARGAAAFFDNFLVWLQFAPVWLLLIWEWRKGRKEGNGMGAAYARES